MVQVKAEFLDVMWTAPAMEAIQSGERHDLDVPLYGRYGHVQHNCALHPTHDIQFDT